MHFLALVIASLSCLARVDALPHGGSPKVQPVVFQGTEMKHLLAFGDSYTYVQGTQGRWNYSFISDAFNYSYTPAQLFSDKIVKNTTSSGGPNWVEYLTGCYEGLPVECPGTKLWDFAFAGSDISMEYLPLHHNYTVPLVDQVKQWDRYARQPLNLTSKDTLVAFWIGINDINDSAKFTNVSFPAWYDTLVGAYFQSVELVYQRGYKNFLFMLLPPLEKTSSNLASSNPQPNTTQVAQFNAAIRFHASAFQKQHSDANALVFDTYTVLNGVLENATAYGITNTTSYCRAYDQPDILWNHAAYGCQPIAQYFWLNSGHITFTAHAALAAALRRELAAAAAAVAVA
ncbi:carbohydrate esterase family 16 protein [Aplosporella prunicola CBS 121167]|uniref:Carbohydrate esterase family 16 protein n=1 Tax=Aplosporella prunicola CBS 121167 TaxID=1176127 RepID=A0A6A6BC36_9PEZI|nr:carbohydrate esterase family 16 protein [Aplosporella prunicola CBS 121167]KAF2140477.1 carbohydrate esterase family 16 protein [Aplosporella prunicola CBS 121167]